MYLMVAEGKDFAVVILYTVAAFEPSESWEVQFWMHLALKGKKTHVPQQNVPELSPRDAL